MSVLIVILQYLLTSACSSVACTFGPGDVNNNVRLEIAAPPHSIQQHSSVLLMSITCIKLPTWPDLHYVHTMHNWQRIDFTRYTARSIHSLQTAAEQWISFIEMTEKSRNATNPVSVERSADVKVLIPMKELYTSNLVIHQQRAARASLHPPHNFIISKDPVCYSLEEKCPK